MRTASPPLSRDLFVGLMTGTSLDGIDAVLVDFSDAMPQLLGAQALPLPDALRQSLLQLQAAAPDELHHAYLASNGLARAYAVAVEQLLAQSSVAPAAIRAIGNHGQTVRHRPELGYTVQLGNHALLAELTGISVIGDFRSRDVAAGGQGAPLVPAFHQAVFGQTGEPCVIANVGGIANISVLDGAGGISGFDTGPGNVLMDSWINQHQGHAYDADGAWAASGNVIPDLLAQWLQLPYFAQLPPKSTGRDLFHADWLRHQAWANAYAPADVQATLCALTAQTLADAVLRHGHNTRAVYLCGGGAHNHTLRQMLAARLPGVRIGTTALLGVDPDWVEAYAFAWLAWCCLNGQPGNLPNVTGASGYRILGAIYPA
ncbi:anhydro-N-acetylmuramic acid kinase [Silvimonas sp. JCM 19000]